MITRIAFSSNKLTVKSVTGNEFEPLTPVKVMNGEIGTVTGS